MDNGSIAIVVPQNAQSLDISGPLDTLILWIRPGTANTRQRQEPSSV
jgi:hypothetical protein